MRRVLRHQTAFTLIELLVVVAIITLLMAITLPSLSRAREQSKAVVCLSNMRQIAALVQAYAAEDRSNQPIPIHPMMLRPTGQRWLCWTANSFVWAGRDGQRPFLRKGADYSGDELWLSSGEKGYIPPHMTAPAYGAADRPLNRWQLGPNFTNRDYVDMPLYRCPADVGYPGEWDDFTGVSLELEQGIPDCSRDTPCYDMFGNSYRASIYFADGFVQDSGALSITPWGHRMDTLPQPSELVLIAEPAFFALGDRHLFDWHHRERLANVMFVDGSARATGTAAASLIDQTEGKVLGLAPAEGGPACNPPLIRSGAGWRLDTFPTPGARIWGDEEDWTDLPKHKRPFNAIDDPPQPSCMWKRTAWPFKDYQRNLE